MQYIMLVEIDDALLDGDDSIENAASVTNEVLQYTEGTVPIEVRPLSEVISC